MVMVVGGDGDDLRLIGPGLEPRVQQEDRDDEEESDESGAQAVDNQRLLEVFRSEDLLHPLLGDAHRVLLGPLKVQVHVVDPLRVKDTESEESFFCETGARCCDRHDESGDAERRVDGDQFGSKRCCRRLATQQQQKTKEANHELQCEESHGGESHPRVKAVKVWNRLWKAGLVFLELVRVPDCDEGHGDAGNGQHVEDGVQQFVPDPTAAAARTVRQHRLSHAIDESCDHEDRMQPELRAWVCLP